MIPAHNEAQRIEACLNGVEKYKSENKYAMEVIIVDDGSTDSTRTIVENWIRGKDGYSLIHFNRNQGKGAAVKTGMLKATGNFRLFSDADLSTPLNELHRFFALMESQQYDVVIASRRVNGAVLIKPQPFLREYSGRIFSLLVRAIVLPGFLDTQCGFKLFTHDAAEKIFSQQTMTGFSFDVELLVIATRKYRFKIKEAPVHWTDSKPTRVNMLKDPLQMFWDLIRIRQNHL